MFFGRLIKAAVSRQREYLADASAVQFTRQTSGLAGALKKIGGLESGSKLRSPKTEEVGHMLFGAGTSLSSLFATHPRWSSASRCWTRASTRPRWRSSPAQWAARPPSGLQEDVSLGLAPAPAPGLAAPQTQVPVAPVAVVADIAAPSEGAFAKAEHLLSQIPAEFLERAHDPAQVAPLVLGLLMADDAEARTVQHQQLAVAYGRSSATTRGVRPTRWRPCIRCCACPWLRCRCRRCASCRSTAPAAFLKQAFTLANADGRVTVYEYCLSRLVYSALTESQQPKSGWRVDRNRLAAKPGSVATLLAVLAQSGNSDPAAAARAFQSGMARVLPGVQYAYTPPAGVTVLEDVWPALEDLPPEDTQRLVEALVAVIAADGVTTITELELLRTICAIQHAPLPL